MSLTTAKFQTLIARNEALQQNVSASSEADLSRSQIRRLEHHQAVRTELDSLASIEPQREAYGLELWHAHFACLSEMETHGQNPLSGYELRQALWDALPNSRFKRFQELFSHPHQLIVPRVMLAEDGSISKPGRQALNTCSLKGCLVSVDLIDDNFAEQTGIAQFTEADQRRPLERLRRKAAGNTVADLKYLFESTASLNDDTRDQRILAIDSPGDPLHGQFLYTRQTGTERDSIPAENGQVAMQRLSVQVFQDAYSVFRRTLHVQAGYDLETGRVASISTDLRGLVRTVAREWRAAASEDLKTTLQSRATTTIGKHEGALEHATGPLKRSAFRLMNASTGLEDTLGRRNPMASIAKLSKADRQLVKRLDETLPKGRANYQDHALIARHIATSERIFENFRLAVEQNADVLSSSRAAGLALFSERRLSPRQIESDATGVMVRLGVHPDDFSFIRLQPYLPFAEAIGDRLVDLACAFRSRDLADSQRALVGAYLGLKFYDVHVAFQDMKEQIRDGAALPLARIKEFANAVTTAFERKAVLPEVIIGAYEQPFMELQSKLRAVNERLNYYSDQNIDVTERSLIYRRLKDYLHSFDIPGIISGLG